MEIEFVIGLQSVNLKSWANSEHDVRWRACAISLIPRIWTIMQNKFYRTYKTANGLKAWPCSVSFRHISVKVKVTNDIDVD